jgi:hypothetical protein
MNLEMEWKVVRHQVTVCGRVVDTEDKPRHGIDVTIWSAPEGGAKARSSAALTGTSVSEVSCMLLSCTKTKWDGIFFFLDIPSGRCTVKSRDVWSSGHAEKTLSISKQPAGKAKIAIANLKLSA